MPEKPARSNVANEILERLRHVDRTLELYRQRTTTIIWLVAVLAVVQVASVAVVAVLGHSRMSTLESSVGSSNRDVLTNLGAISEKLESQNALQLGDIGSIDVEQLLETLGNVYGDGGAIQEQLDALEGRRPRDRQ